jgi:arginyl-tRNA synthetase
MKPFNNSINKLTSLSDALNTIFSEAFRTCGLDSEYGHVTISQRPDLSDYQCNGALAAAKGAKKNPRLIAQEIINIVKDNPIFTSLTIDGPGFINIKLSDQFLMNQAQLVCKGEYATLLSSNSKKKTIIDFGGPNIAKPMHVGHIRSTVIGDCLQRLFKFLGVPIHSDIHMGDWGTQMGMLICEVQSGFPNLPYFDANFEGPYPSESPVTISDLEEMYPKAATKCKSDEKEMLKAQQATVELQAGRKGYRALWQHFVNISVASLKEDFSQLDVTFDLWCGESHYHDQIPEMIKSLKQNNLAVISDEALVVPIEGENEQEIPPLMLVKSDGGYLYGTTDLATIQERVSDFGDELILYVVDKRQGLHFQQVFLAAHKTGIANSQIRMEHLAFGTVNGTDGKPFKTRAGGVMKLKDLISLAKNEAFKRIEEINGAEKYDENTKSDIANKVGLAALKYGDLMHDRQSDYIFDLSKFTRFEGKTGPYILYAAVRINSILTKAVEQKLAIGPITLLNGNERDLLLELCKFPDVILNAYTYRMPSYLCTFCFDLAQQLNRFYLQCHILKEQNKDLQSSWLGILQLCFFQLETTLYLLGIEIPDHM